MYETSPYRHHETTNWSLSGDWSYYQRLPAVDMLLDRCMPPIACSRF